MPPGSPQKRPRGPQDCPKRAPGWLETPRQSVTASNGQHGNQRNARCRHPLLWCSLSRKSRPLVLQGRGSWQYQVPRPGGGAPVVCPPGGVWGGTPRDMAPATRGTPAEDGRSRPHFCRRASGRHGRPQDGPQDGPRRPRVAERSAQGARDGVPTAQGAPKTLRDASKRPSRRATRVKIH